MTSKRFSVLARVVAAIAAVGVVVAGASAGASTTAKSGQPVKGGSLSFINASEPPGMDPIQLREVPQISPAFSAHSIFDELVYTDPATLKVKPKMATSLTTNDKGLTWVMKLHSGIRFSDGTPLDAAAVQFNWQRVADPVNKVAFAGPAQEIATYETPDPLTLKVTLKAADPIWDQLVARNLSTIGSPTALKANATAFQRKPVGAGPYLLKEWIPASSIVMVRNPDYWQKGKPYIDQISQVFINDDSARGSSVLSGSVQAAIDGAWTNLEQYKAAGKFAAANTPANGGGYAMTFNLQKAPGNDPRFRQAMALVLDSKEIVQRTGDGDETWMVKTIDEKFSPFYDPKLKPAKTDPVAAQKLIDQIVAEQGGKPISFTWLSLQTPVHVRIATAVQAILASKLKNVDMKIEIVSSVAGVPRQAAGDFQITMGGPRWTDPALDMAGFFQSTSPLNYGHYSNPAVDGAIKTLATTIDPKAKQQAHHTIVENVLKDLPVIYLIRFRTYYAYDKTLVKDWNMFYEMRVVWEDLWLAKPKS